MSIIKLLTLCSLSVFAALARADADFEAPPSEPVRAIPGADQAAGEYLHIVDPVQSDGLMHHFVIDSRYGTFAAYGPHALSVRVSEITALNTLAHTSKTEIVINSLLRAGARDAPAVAKLATRPISSVLGVPQGIAHLLGGYVAEAMEIKESIDRAKSEDHESKDHAAGSGQARAADHGASSGLTADARNYAAKYLGVTQAERRWYQKLAVDPYTDNQMLRHAVHEVAKLDAAAGFGLKFVSLPRVPYGEQLNRAMDAIYRESPATLRERRRSELESYGLSDDEIDRFEHTLLLNPTRQNALAEIARSLAGVSGRAELMRHAMTVTSEEEIEVFVRSAALLPALHRAQPLSKILAGLRIPAAETTDGRQLIAAGVDAVSWTSEVAGYEKALREALGSAVHRDLWIEGTVTARAQAELIQRGWVVHEHAAAGTMHKAT